MKLTVKLGDVGIRYEDNTTPANYTVTEQFIKNLTKEVKDMHRIAVQRGTKQIKETQCTQLSVS